MQTFLPYADFKLSAKCLDRQRLGKQRVEAWQLLRGQWSNHPASIMWSCYHPALAKYGRIICLEWIDRGYNDTMLERFEVFLTNDIVMPYWVGDEAFHLSHQSNLVRKTLNIIVNIFQMYQRICLMSGQLELFRTTVLAKLAGMLVLIEVNPSKGDPLKCPICKNTKFEEVKYGWVGCYKCYNFAMLKDHINKIESQWYEKKSNI